MMKHFFRTIPGWANFKEIYMDAVAAAPQEGAVFVELGTWKGRSVAFMGVEIANSGKDISFHVCDTFKGSGAEGAQDEDPVVRDGRLLEVFKNNIRPVRKYVTEIFEGTSVDFASTFKNETVDLVLIDALHQYESVKADIAAWWPKVKPGGVLAGDDYRWAGVKRAADEFGASVGLPVISCCGKLKNKCWKVIKP